MNFTDLVKHGYRKFINSPNQLFALYIIVNMIPSYFLFFTEPFNIWGKLILLIFPMGLYIATFSLFKNNGLLQLVLFPVLFLHAFELVLLYLFGEDVIAADMFLNVATTNVSEASEVLNSIWPSVIFVCVIYLPTTALAIRQMRKRIFLDIKKRKRSFVIGSILLVVSFVMSFFAVDKNTNSYSMHEDIYPVNMFYNLNFAISKWNRTRMYPETSKDFSFNAKRDSVPNKREVYVLVIGETSRADNWSLYGYGRSTTPLLEKKDNLIHFRDALTQSNTTHKSVSIMLSAASAENYDIIYEHKSVLEAFKEVGFSTVFLSNQGENQSFTEYFSHEADFYRNYRGLNKGITHNHHDMDMLPQMRQCIDSMPGNLFIVLHSYGSHFNYSERYTEGFSTYQPDNVTNISEGERDILYNAYDNSIRYTDAFLSQVMDILEETGAESTLLYSSDHGEDILDDERGRFLHASPSPTYYQLRIPILLWFSKNYVEAYPQKYEQARINSKKPISTNSIFHTLLNLASIKTEYLEEDLSLISPTFTKRKRMYLNDHDDPIIYYKMNLKKQDFEMIKKNNLYM